MTLPGAGDMVVSGRILLFRGRRIPVTVGRGGTGWQKREGDGVTPAGVHRIVGMFYRPDRVSAASLPGWAVPIRRGDLWCDAPGHADYNHLVPAPFAASHEWLWRADPLYDLVLVTDWNWPDAVPGAGSAIFLHRWRRPGAPTAGCVAMDPADLRWVAARTAPGQRLVIRG